MPAHIKVEASWVANVLELPYDYDNLEAAIGEAIWRFLHGDLLSREQRQITVDITEIALDDPGGRIVAVRTKDGLEPV